MPPLSQAPGFPPACAAPLWCSLDGWVVMGGLMADALIVTTTLLALALFISLAGRRKRWRELAPLLLVGLCALIAVLCVVRLLQLNLPITWVISTTRQRWPYNCTSRAPSSSR